MNQTLQLTFFTYLALLVAGAATFFAYPPYFIFPLLVMSYSFFLYRLTETDTVQKHMVISGVFWGGFYLVHFYWFYPLCYYYLEAANAFNGHNLQNLYLSGTALAFCLLSIFPSFLISCLGTVSAAQIIKKTPPLWAPLIFATFICLSELYRGFPYEYGSPWALTGYAASNNLFLIQLASTPLLTYGLGFIILLFCSLFYRPSKNNILTAALVAVMCFISGSLMLHASQKNISNNELALRLIQTNSPLGTGESAGLQMQRMHNHVNMTNDPDAQGRDLTIWSENALPPLASTDDAVIAHIQNNAKTPVLTGALIFNETENAYQNAIALIDHDGLKKVSSKQLLVPYAEYNPAPFLDQLIYSTALTSRPRFTPGKLGNINFQEISVLALNCYEMIFAAPVNKFADSTGLYFILANDAWFQTFAPHMIKYNSYIARMRAVENRRPVVRNANAGETAIISAHGEFLLRQHNSFPATYDYDLKF